MLQLGVNKHFFICQILSCEPANVLFTVPVEFISQGLV